MMNRRRLLGVILGSLGVGCARDRDQAKILMRPGRPETRTVTFQWTADPKVRGYRLYTGRASRDYDFAIDLGNVTEVTCAITETGPRFFAVTALTEYGESEFSAERMYRR